jgi:hypothetical protein
MHFIYYIGEREYYTIGPSGGGAKISNFSREKFSCLARWCRGGAVVWEVGAKHISIRPVSRMPGLACGIRCTVVDAKKSEEANI